MPPRPMPPEKVMLPILLVAALVGAAGIAVPTVMLSTPTPTPTLLPWFLLALGVAGIAVAVFERNPKIDFKANVKANAMVLLFGPIGARVGYALVGGGFLGGAIGLFIAP